MTVDIRLGDQGVLGDELASGISADTLRGWYRRGEVDQGRRDGTRTQEREEIRALKAKVRWLEEDNEVLRGAMVFFASVPD